MKVAVLSDLHTRERPADQYKDLFARASREAQALILCGDLTDLGLPAEAAVLAEAIHYCTVPVCGILGNHDYHSEKVDEVREILCDAGMHFLDEESYVLGDVAFAGTKGFGGGFANHMLAYFGEPMDKKYVQESIGEALKLEHLLQVQAKHIIVALHYSPIEATVHGEPKEIYPFLGTSRLAETIDRYPVSVVFHGHAHYGSHEGHTPKGIPVYNVSRSVLQREGLEYFLYKV